MELAKPHVDVGLYTNQREELLDFWQNSVGLPFEELLPAGRGVHQLRHGMNGSVMKINHSRDPLQPAPPAGYRELCIARPGLLEPSPLLDPDGNRVLLVPEGGEVEGIEVRLSVSDEAAFHDFYGHVLELPRCRDRAYRCGDSILSFRLDPGTKPAGDMRAPGFRYLTVQVHDADREHAQILERGGVEGTRPVTLGEVARISFVRDPDGNWIEISQRASLTGAL